jgi:AmiR/NasT family two-component response regulator
MVAVTAARKERTMRGDADVFETRLAAAQKTRPAIDQAKGVLVGTRCESPEAAFAELKYVSESNHFKVVTVAAALVDFAAGREVDDPALAEVIRREWGQSLSKCS